MFVCKICGSEVNHGQAFCRKCGADVVENYETVCPVCGARNGAGSRYCAKCGTILGVMRKPVCAVCGVKNLPGAKYCVSCGSPLAIDSETHSDDDMIEARKTKQRLDNMARDRMAAVDKEIAEKRAQAADEREKAMQEVEDYRTKCEEDYTRKLSTLEAYRDKINELGSDDVDLLKKMSLALKDYSRYYADPYSQIDEDDIDTEIYVCPACGRINPINATACTNCGRDKARALSLLAKGKIKQHPPVKRKQTIIKPPEEDLERQQTPSLDEFAQNMGKPQPAEDKNVDTKNPDELQAKKQEPPADFSGPGSYYGYPPFFGFPPQMQPGMFGAYYQGMDEQHRQMPPIVQPVAFVPYVTQEQPLMQYSPTAETDVYGQPLNARPVKPAPQAQPVQPSEPQEPPRQSRRSRKSDKI